MIVQTLAVHTGQLADNGAINAANFLPLPSQRSTVRETR